MEEIEIQSLTLNNGSEIVFYDFVSSITNEELGGIDINQAMEDAFGSAGIASEETEELSELFSDAENPFGGVCLIVCLKRPATMV